MSDGKKVVLFYPYPDPQAFPAYEDVKFWVPLSTMTVGSHLLHQGYEVVLIDQRMENDPLKRVLAELEGAVCLGVSTITGASIIEGLKVSEEVKRSHPKIPIIWGGVHPTLLPEQTVAHPAVDIVARGQGEVTMSELVKTLATRAHLEQVEGVTFKREGRVFSTPARPVTDINDFPSLSYSLIDVERHMETFSEMLGRRSIDGRKPKAISYNSSFGCPYTCRFCSEHVMSGGKWFGLRADRVVKEIRHLVEKYGVEMIVFADENLFVKPSRVKDFCRLLLDQNIEILWAAASRPDNLARFDDSDINLLYRGGCRLIFVGAESGCQKTLDLLNKRMQPEVTELVTRKFTENKIAIHLSYMLAVPDEPKESAWQTSRQVNRLASDNSLVTLVYNYYSPYPGNDLFDRAVELGFTPPQSLEGWATVVHRNVNLPTVDVALFHKFDLLRFMFMSKPKPGIRNLLRNVVVLLLRICARIRLGLKTFALPLDLFLMNVVAKRKPGARRAMSVEA